MARKPVMTENRLVAYLQAVRKGETDVDKGDFLTSYELKKKVGLSIGTLRLRIREANELGLLEVSSKKIKAIDEEWVSVPAYRMKDDETINNS